MLSRKLIKLVKNVACSAAVLSGTVLAVQSQVNAETLQIGGFGLNTNNNFSRIDGQPKMSSWQTNPNDNDQQFDQVRGNRGGMMLKHRSTGKCVNAYRIGNGSEFNVWPCDPNDGDQNWNIINLGGGKVQLQKVGTNSCIDMPYRSNYGKVHIWTCDRNNGNQQWISSSQTTQPPSQQVDLQGLIKLIYGNNSAVVTSPYGYQRCDIWGKVYKECKHPALDIAGSHQTPIYSPIEGEVIDINNDSGKVAIYNSKSNITFFFGHMNRSDVSKGQYVRKGQQVGIQGTKGYVTGSHLHFEARPGKQPYMATEMSQTLNPLDAVNQANR